MALWLATPRVKELSIRERTLRDWRLVNSEIGAYSRHTLNFTDLEHFDWGVKHSGSSWILKLHVVGRKKPFLLRVYRND